MFIRYRGPLYARAGDGGGAGGGAGAGAGAGEGNPGFDPKTFMAEMLGEFDKRVNALDKKIEKVMKSMPQPKATGDGDGTGTGTGTGDGTGTGTASGTGDGGGIGAGDPAQGAGSGKGAGALPPEVNARFQAMEKALKQSGEQIKQLTSERETERKQRLETERTSAIRDALAGIELRDDDARKLAYKMFQGDIKRDDDGNFIGETDKGTLPLKDYLETNIPAWMLQPKGGGGAGASSGVRRPGGPGLNIDQMSVEQIRNLKPEERAQLGTGLAEQMRGGS